MDNFMEMPLAFHTPLSEIGFVSLPEDVVRNIFEFIPLVERIKFERVNTTWATLFEDMWLKRKRLAFCFERNYSIFPPTKCRIKNHAFVEMDIVHLHSPRDRKKSLILIQRCPELKVLNVRCKEERDNAGKLVYESTLATVVNEKCPKLEHIEGIAGEFALMFEPSSAFRCYHHPKMSRITTAYQLILKWSNVQMNSITTCPTMFKAIDLPSFADLEVLHCSAQDWTMYKIGSLTKLKALHLGRYHTEPQIHAYSLIKNLQLEELTISIYSATGCYLKDILSSTNLKVLKLHHSRRKHYSPNGLLTMVQLKNELEQVLQIVTEFSPNLIKFSLWIESGRTDLMSAKYWVELTKLTKLRKFGLKHVDERPDWHYDLFEDVSKRFLPPGEHPSMKCNENCAERKKKLFDGVQLLLQDAKKLRSIKLDYKACYDDHDLRAWCKALAILGGEHPKRLIKFHFNDNRIVNENLKRLVPRNVYLFHWQPKNYTVERQI